MSEFRSDGDAELLSVERCEGGYVAGFSVNIEVGDDDARDLMDGGPTEDEHQWWLIARLAAEKVGARLEADGPTSDRRRVAAAAG